jgi:glutamine amidotransferase
MGWNNLKIKEGAKLFAGLEQDPYVYFVHSYYLKAKNEEDVAAITEYSTLIHASVEHDNIFACQFHPEKSSKTGLKILENFVSL